MKAKDVVIGATVKTYIGEELAEVVVVCERAPIGYPWDKRKRPMEYLVRRVGEERCLPKPRTAAALRPLAQPTMIERFNARVLSEIKVEATLQLPLSF